MLEQLKKEVFKFSDPRRAKINAWFFKTGKGEYGEGDKFIGLTVPMCREVSKKFIKLSLSEISKLLRSDLHEYRLIALLILVQKFQKSAGRERNKIFDFYLKNTKYVNNWDLVDMSADKIVGTFLLYKNRKVLYDLAKSKNLWEKRIAIMATFQFIKEKKEYEDTFKVAKILLSDKHDLIHKAVGWMLERGRKKNIGSKRAGFFKKTLQTNAKDNVKVCN